MQNVDLDSLRDLLSLWHKAKPVLSAMRDELVEQCIMADGLEHAELRGKIRMIDELMDLPMLIEEMSASATLPTGDGG